MFDNIDENRIIEMAWEDRTPFDAIHRQFGISEKEVIVLMRRTLKSSSFNISLRKIGFGNDSRGSRPGFSKFSIINHND